MTAESDPRRTGPVPGGPVFLDAASGEPMDPVAREAYLAALDEGWADADRLYREGRRARMLLDAAREAVAESLGARPDETVFTTSGTAAIHLAVAGMFEGRARVGRRIVTSAVEHSAVLHAAQFTAERSGGTTETVPVGRTGRIDVEALHNALAPGGSPADSLSRPAYPNRAAYSSSPSLDPSHHVALVCIQAANHEVGTAQPLAEAWDLCADHSIPLLVDACAALGRTAPPEHWSALCGSARKWGGPGGVGVLALRKGTRFAPAWPEDEREGGRAPGPVNVPAVLAAAAALRARTAEREAVAARHTRLVELIRTRVLATVPDVEVVGEAVDRLPHIVTFSCLYASGEALLTELDRRGFSVSSGSSCTASTLTPSHVLEAMGVLSHGNVRVSLPWRVGEEEVERFLRALPEVVADVRAQAPDTPTLTPTTSTAPALPAPASPTPVAPHTTAATTPPPPSSAPPPSTPLPPLPTPADLGAALILDTLGRACPIPVIELAKRISSVTPGGVVAVLADDPAARLDIPAWCRMRGQAYLGERPLTGRAGAAYLVRREL